MPIGRFSRLTGLAVKALRHYDELGLLASGRGRSRDRVSLLLGRPGRPSGGDPPRCEGSSCRSTTSARRSPPGIRRRCAPRSSTTSGRSRLATPSFARSREAATADRRKGDGHGNALGVARAEEHRRLGIDLFNKTWTLMEKADAGGRRRDAPLRARVGLPLDAGGRDGREPCARRVAVLARATRSSAGPSPRSITRAAASRSSRPRRRDGGLGHRRRARGARAGASRRRRDGGGAPLLRARARRTTAKIADDDDRELIEADLATIAPCRGRRLGAVRGEW